MSSSLVVSIADGIEVVEGFYPGSRAWRNNNPGNIWDGMPQRIWPYRPVDSEGFLVFESYEAGRAELENQVALKISRGMTLRQLLTAWAPASDPRNNPAAYTAAVSVMTGLDPDVPLNAGAGGVSWPNVVPGGVDPPAGVSTLPALTWPGGDNVSFLPAAASGLPDWAPWVVGAAALYLVVVNV